MGIICGDTKDASIKKIQAFLEDYKEFCIVEGIDQKKSKPNSNNIAANENKLIEHKSNYFIVNDL